MKHSERDYNGHMSGDDSDNVQEEAEGSDYGEAEARQLPNESFRETIEEFKETLE